MLVQLEDFQAREKKETFVNIMFRSSNMNAIGSIENICYCFE